MQIRTELHKFLETRNKILFFRLRWINLLIMYYIYGNLHVLYFFQMTTKGGNNMGIIFPLNWKTQWLMPQMK